MENSQERGATKKARKQPTGGYMEVQTQNSHAARGPDAMKAQASACKPHGKYTHPWPIIYFFHLVNVSSVDVNVIMCVPLVV